MAPPARRIAILLGLALAWPSLLSAKTISVPREFATIRSAVLAARPGDTIEVDDGIYLETNIIVDKNLRIRARRPFGAVIYGEDKDEGAIFVIRAVVALEGFILKNAARGILLRGRPEASLTGRDLALLNMRQDAVSINDVSSNYGKVRLTSVYVDRAGTAFSTNDAHTLEVRYALVANCDTVFSGYDHIRFFAERVILWNCGAVKSEAADVPAPPATNTILLGKRVLTFDPAALGAAGGEKPVERLHNLVERIGEGGDDKVLRTMQGFGFLATGEIYLKLGEPRPALPFFRNALSVGASFGLSEIVWRAHYGLARVLESLGGAEDALTAYKASIAAVEADASSLPARPDQGPFLSDKLSVYESAIRYLVALDAETPARGFALEAFLLSERSKAHGFLEVLASFDPASTWKALGPELTERTRSIYLDLSRTQARLRDPAVSDAGREAVLGELGLIDARFRNLLGEVRLSHPEFMRPVAPAEDLSALRSAVLGGDTALCEYFAGAEASFLFTLTAEGLSVDRLPPRDEIAGLVANYLRFLTLRTSPSFDAVAGGKRLHDLLIGPARARLGPAVRRLVIVPDDSLWALPFEALVCCESAAPADPRAVRRGGKPPARFLVEDLEVVYAPSARALAGLFARPRSAPRSMDLLAVANAEAFLDRSLSSNARLDLPALASTEREIKAIRSVFPKGRTVLLVDGEATEAAFFRSPPAAFRVIHIAAHAVFDDQNWWRSAILLRPDQAAGADGLLQPLDIYLNKLSADVVVLSGCRTAVGQSGRADGVTGLVSGFLHAGARSVVSSLWSVEDESSARLMSGLYAALTDGASTAAALRKAKLALLKSDFGHPFHWAGFVLTGNYAARLD